MDMDKLNQRLLVASHLGIIAGLILVGFQINQDNKLTRLQIFSDTTASRIQMHEALMGDNPAPIVMKSLLQPEELSLGEIRVMDAYLLSAVNEARIRLVLAQQGLRVDSTEEENLLLFYFGNRFAQEWWKQFISSGEDMENKHNIELTRIIGSAENTEMTLDFFRSLGNRLNIKSVEGI
jgi:hypothetical protein